MYTLYLCCLLWKNCLQEPRHKKATGVKKTQSTAKPAHPTLPKKVSVKNVKENKFPFTDYDD